MYIIQECIDENTWLDRYSHSDYDTILQFYHNFIDKYKHSNFRVIEVFYYV